MRRALSHGLDSMWAMFDTARTGPDHAISLKKRHRRKVFSLATQNPKTFIILGNTMKRTVLFVIFAIFSGSAAAEWTLLSSDTVKTEGVDAGRGVKTFIDKKSTNANGDRVTMWSLSDYESPVPFGGKQHLSSKSLDEYDCKNNEYRNLSVYWYSRHKAAGDTVYSETAPGKMQPIVSGSIVEKQWKTACGK
jgi:hypothetical protein